MKLKLHLKTALRNLRASPLRSFLAILGIMIGTASVVALISGGSLATQQAIAQIKALGTSLMRINFDSISNSDSKPKLNVDKILALKTNIPGIIEVAPIATISTSGVYQQILLETISVIGSTQNLADMMQIKIKSGRFINDLDKSQNFCVVGAVIAKQLNSIYPLGTYLKYGNSICTIVGITDASPENYIAGIDINTSIILPYAATIQVPEAMFSSALMRIREDADIDTLKMEITDYFKKNIPGYTLSITSAKEIVNSIAKQQAIFTLLLGLIGGISLLVGGIGVMNIMLASVAERHSEIGLRIALGARPRDVQMMFLMEAATLAILGGGMGVILGVLSTVIIAYAANWKFVLFFWPPLIGFGVSLLISLFFGFYPAYIASKLNPIETLRA